MLRDLSNPGKTAPVTQPRNLSLRPDRDAVESSSGEWEGVAGSNLFNVAGQEEEMVI